MTSEMILVSPLAPALAKAWVLPSSGLTVFYGCPEMPRLSHYFLPRVFVQGQQVLYLDGANQFDPLLIAHFARQRAYEPPRFNRLIRVQRAFTCFQLTELLVRAPKRLEDFPAGVLVITALPELYFDEDAGEAEASASFKQALEALRRLRRQPLSVAVFSDAPSFSTPRKRFFRQVTLEADQVWRVSLKPDQKPAFTCEKAKAGLLC